MARVDNHEGFSFLHWGGDVAIRPHGEPFESRPYATVPMSAVHAAVLAGAAAGRPSGQASFLAELLLGEEAGTFSSAEAHPSVRREGDHVVVTGPDWETRDIGKPIEVTYRVPFSAMRRFTLLLFEGALVSAIENSSFDDIERLALAILPPEVTR